MTSPKFNLGDQVRQSRDADWLGTIVGTYSTSLTPEGYVVESVRSPGVIYTYPVSALHLWTESKLESVLPELLSDWKQGKITGDTLAARLLGLTPSAPAIKEKKP